MIFSWKYYGKLCTTFLRANTNKFLLASECNVKATLEYHKQTSSKAWRIRKYSPSAHEIQLDDVPLPLLSPSDILVEVHAASVNPIDLRMKDGYGSKLFKVIRKSNFFRYQENEFPLTLGRDFSGVIIDKGMSVSSKNFARGDQVWGVVSGLKPGSHATHVLVTESELTKKPKTLSHTEAASIPAVALTSWSALSTIGGLTERTTPNKRVLILGGSGGVGTFTIQWLKYWGAEITVTCSDISMNLCESLGADYVIDYRDPDFKYKLNNVKEFDLIYDTVGDQEDWVIDLLKVNQGAKFISIASPFLSNIDDRGITFGFAKTTLDFSKCFVKELSNGRLFCWAVFMPNTFALETFSKLCDNQKIQPVIQTVHPFEETPEAYLQYDKKQKQGKTVISIK